MYKKVRPLNRLFLSCLIFCLVSPLSLWADGLSGKRDSAASKWPYQLSDLKPDPSIIRGVLPNGLKYVIKKNHEPENRVAAYLAVLAGSMEERDEEQGVAHFLEHLMFNGSTHFPPGTLIEYFQSIGMDFGGDTNAYTGFNKTVYHLILPSGEESELDIACKVLADFARGALLLDSEIDRERGVIFSEKRSRDSASYRNYVAYSEYAFKGTRYPLRLPIGKETVLKTAEHMLLKGYYDRWYRPDNMILVLVGDLDQEAARRTISNRFGPLKKSSVSADRPAFGTLEHTGIDVFYHYEPELGKTNVSIETLWNVSPKTPTKKDEKEELFQIIGNLIVGYRLQQAQEKVEQPYTGAHYSAGKIAQRIGYGSIYGTSDETSWKKTLMSLHETIEIARLYGFTTKEVTRAKNEIQAELENNLQTASSLHSRVIAERIVDHLVDGDVYMSPLQEAELYTPMLSALTVEDINKGFRSVWDNPNRLISISGTARLGEDGKTEIKNVYKSIVDTKIAKRKTEKKPEFPYLPPVPGAIGEMTRTFYPALEMSRYTFQNGLIINLKKTDFEQNNLRVSAQFGRGEQDEERAGMAYVAEDVVNLSGTKSLSNSDLDFVTAGSSVELSFRIGRESSSWSGSTLSREIELFVQVLQTMLLDADFDEVAFNKVKRRLKLMYARLDSDIDGAVLRKVQPFLSGNNMHYGLPPWEQMRDLSFSDTEKYVKKILDIKDLEISVVGDFDEDHIVSVFNKYLGGLELEHPQKGLSKENIIFPEGGRLEVDVPSEVNKSTVILTWPTDDFWDIGRTRRLSILAAVLEDRIRKTVREKLGASYSPQVISYGSRIHNNYGYLQVQINVERGKEEYLIGEIKILIEQLTDGGITDEELIRAKNPVLTSVFENVKTNRYWLSSVLALSARHSAQLLWPITIVDDINSITSTDLDQLADTYLRDEKVAVAIIKAGLKDLAHN